MVASHANVFKEMNNKIMLIILMAYNAANNGRLVIVDFVQQWRSHAQNAQVQGCPVSEANGVAWLCYVLFCTFSENQFGKSGFSRCHKTP